MGGVGAEQSLGEGQLDRVTGLCVWQASGKREHWVYSGLSPFMSSSHRRQGIVEDAGIEIELG